MPSDQRCTRGPVKKLLTHSFPMPGKRTQLFVRILLLVGTLTALYFVPWKLLRIRLTPLPDTVAEQVENAVGYGFAPGSAYAYSSTNYLLLSLIMERVLGYDKFVYIKEAILEPLGLERTYTSIHAVDPVELMSGYYVGVAEDTKLTDYDSMVATVLYGS